MSVDVLQVTMRFKPWKQDVASKPFTVLHENYKKVKVELLSACSRPWVERGAGVFIQYSAPAVMHLLRLPCESSLGEIGDRALEMILVPCGILSLGCMLDPRIESYPLGSWHPYPAAHCWPWEPVVMPLSFFLQAYLTDFLCQFAQQPCYIMFSCHLNDNERRVLQTIGI